MKRDPEIAKWNRAAGSYDRYSHGAERRWAPWKRDLFARFGAGRILFLAAGTGLDFQFFPAGKKLTALDFSAAMLKEAAPRAAQYDGRIELLQGDARRLPFADRTFDQIFTACTFCSVPHPVQGLAELRRVLRPGGELLMFEHTGSRWFPFNLMLNAMTPLSRRVGPEMNRDTAANLQAAGWRIRRVENLYLDVLKVFEAV